EHVPEPERTLEEVMRILKPGGLCVLAPAWNVRTWASKGLPVRPYQALSYLQKAEKASILLRDLLLWRAMTAIPSRMVRELRLLTRATLPFEYKRLSPNLDEDVYTD